MWDGAFQKRALRSWPDSLKRAFDRVDSFSKRTFNRVGAFNRKRGYDRLGFVVPEFSENTLPQKLAPRGRIFGLLVQ